MRKHLTAKETELIKLIKDRTKKTKLINDMARHWQQTRHLALEPVTIEEVEEAERQLGFSLPPFLRELYLQIGNGVFGPGYGLFRLLGRHDKDDQAIVTTYKMSTGPDVPSEYDSWHPRHIDILHWGDNIYSAVDCTTADAPVYRYWMDRYLDTRDGPLREYGIMEAMSLREWFELWLAGEDISNAYGQPR